MQFLFAKYGKCDKLRLCSSAQKTPTGQTRESHGYPSVSATESSTLCHSAVQAAATSAAVRKLMQ